MSAQDSLPPTSLYHSPCTAVTLVKTTFVRKTTFGCPSAGRNEFLLLPGLAQVLGSLDPLCGHSQVSPGGLEDVQWDKTSH